MLTAQAGARVDSAKGYCATLRRNADAAFGAAEAMARAQTVPEVF